MSAYPNPRPYQSSVERVERLPTPDELRARGIDNVLSYLPLSPCVRSKKTGRIFPFHSSWAKRPEAFENCDENCNTDPAALQGRGPVGWQPEDDLNYRAPLEPIVSEPYASDVRDGYREASTPEPIVLADPSLPPPGADG